MGPDVSVGANVLMGTLLSALNTGHEGGCGTLHANRAADVPARLEALACAAGLTREAVHSQLAAALDVIVHLVRDPAGGRRRVSEVSLLERAPDGLVGVLPAVAFTEAGDVVAAPGAEALATRLNHRWTPPRPSRKRTTTPTPDTNGVAPASPTPTNAKHGDQPHPKAKQHASGHGHSGHLDQARFRHDQDEPDQEERTPEERTQKERTSEAFAEFATTALTTDQYRNNHPDPDPDSPDRPSTDRLRPPP